MGGAATSLARGVAVPPFSDVVAVAVSAVPCGFRVFRVPGRSYAETGLGARGGMFFSIPTVNQMVANTMAAAV